MTSPHRSTPRITPNGSLSGAVDAPHIITAVAIVPDVNAGRFEALRLFVDWLASSLAARLMKPLRDMLRELLLELLPAPAMATGLPTSSSVPPGYLSVEDAARWCGGVSPSTWRDWSTRGIVPAPARIGGRVFWRMDDLRDWSTWGQPGRAVFEERRAARDRTGK